MLQIHQRSSEHLHKSKLKPRLSSSFTEFPQTEGRRPWSALPHLQRTTIPYRPAHQELSPESAADGDRPHSRTRGDALECAGFRRKDRESEFDSSIDPLALIQTTTTPASSVWQRPLGSIRDRRRFRRRWRPEESEKAKTSLGR